MPAPLTEEQFSRLLGRCSYAKQRRIAKLAKDIEYLQRTAATSRFMGNPEMHKVLTGIICDNVLEIEHILLRDPGVPEIPAPPGGCVMLPHYGRVS
ncbi:hypothetical protein HLH26_15805 [Gluconacetobacter sp. 1b LMG 1731]|uniref:Uncharacterized protein n=1 Tax=Gluconacetobacter dulcium TaxID=2729096 RepID=A0A7W4INB0_9PROT|nr:hypothetical protein [Gluconacetobacter dulcium]MBB2165968.1 hypothetical protein [Gluconacetobacter dulcium]MBB2195105.1 hypothetical protein [Gluconacetobacter dulcium]